MVATTKDQDKLLLNVHFHSFCPFPSSPFQCRGNLCIGRPGLSSFNPPVASKGTCFRIYARIPSKRQPIDCRQVSLPLLDFQQSFLQSRGHHLEGKRVKDEASNSKQSQVLPINLDITFHLTNEITGSFLKSHLYYPQGCFLFIRMILDFTKPPASNCFFRKAEGDLRKPGAHLVAEFGSDRNEYSNLDPQIIARIQSPNAGRLVGWLVGFFLRSEKVDRIFRVMERK